MSLVIKGESQGMETLTLIPGIRTAQEVVVLSPASVDTALAVVFQGPAEDRTPVSSRDKIPPPESRGVPALLSFAGPVSEAVVSLEASLETSCVSSLQLSAGGKKW